MFQVKLWKLITEFMSPITLIGDLIIRDPAHSVPIGGIKDSSEKCLGELRA